MAGRIWDPFLTEHDQAVIALAGYQQPMGFGRRPALLIVDASLNFTGERPESIFEMIKSWRNACGEPGWVAIGQIKRLLEACREKRLPVFYTTGERRSDGLDSGAWGWKNARARKDFVHEERGNTIVPDIAPRDSEFVIKKQKPSAFFGTTLASYLIERQVDTLLITGVSTSGCVRATVIDGFSYNYRCCVVEEGCYDRSMASHAINLFDMHAKYADVVGVDATIDYVRGLTDGLFAPIVAG